MNPGANDFTLVQIVVCSLSFSAEQADHSNLFVISLDFCHWGPRFSYTSMIRCWVEKMESIQDRNYVRATSC